MIPLGGTGMSDSRVSERSKSMGRSHLPAKFDRFSVVLFLLVRQRKERKISGFKVA